MQTCRHRLCLDHRLPFASPRPAAGALPLRNSRDNGATTELNGGGGVHTLTDWPGGVTCATFARSISEHGVTRIDALDAPAGTGAMRAWPSERMSLPLAAPSSLPVASSSPSGFKATEAVTDEVSGTTTNRWAQKYGDRLDAR